MSYSRFSNSVWYTYWHCASGHAIDQQYLAVHHVKDTLGIGFYCYGDGVQGYVDAYEKRLLELGFDVSPAEKDELKGYIEIFEEEVEDEFL